MKPKKSEILTIVLFCGFLCAMLAGYLLLPKTNFSQLEKRYLTEVPDANWEDIASGDWGEDAESYMADHIPLRDFFVGLNAYFDLLTGRQAGKDIRVAGDALVEAPAKADPARIKRNLSILNTFAETVGQTVDFAIVPSAGWATGLDGYDDEAIISDIYTQAGETLNCVDMRSTFAGRSDLYYRTDHHWTSAGAYIGYQTYMTEIGREFRAESDFSKEIIDDFRGSTYSRSALWLTPGEKLELWHGSDNLIVTNAESEEVQDVFARSRLEEADKYTVFLDGNHSLVRIVNPEKSGKLLVIRDSYSNCLGPFLAESYGEVVLIDLRHYVNPVSELASAESFDNILILYSIGNFLTDTNLPRLR